jgi:hypothetical protein
MMVYIAADILPTYTAPREVIHVLVGIKWDISGEGGIESDSPCHQSSIVRQLILRERQRNVTMIEMYA